MRPGVHQLQGIYNLCLRVIPVAQVFGKVNTADICLTEEEQEKHRLALSEIL